MTLIMPLVFRYGNYGPPAPKDRFSHITPEMLQFGDILIV